MVTASKATEPRRQATIHSTAPSAVDDVRPRSRATDERGPQDALLFGLLSAQLADDVVDGDGFLFALELVRTHFLEEELAAHAPGRLRRHERLPADGLALQPGRGVDGVAGDAELA